MMFLCTAWCTEAANGPGQPPSEGKRQQQKEFEDMSDAEQQVLDDFDTGRSAQRHAKECDLLIICAEAYRACIFHFLFFARGLLMQPTTWVFVFIAGNFHSRTIRFFLVVIENILRAP